MAYDLDANILKKTFEGTPLHCHIVADIARIGENGFVARQTTAFELFGSVIVNTEGTVFVPPSAGIRICLTFIDVIFAIDALVAIRASLIATEELILTIVCRKRKSKRCYY